MTNEARTMADDAAEQAVLGMMMASPTCVEPVADLLATRDFYDVRHGDIYAAIIALWAGDQPTTPIAVGRFLAEQGDLGRVGGAPYLHTLYANAPGHAGTVGYYAQLVADWSLRRRLRESGFQVVQAAQNLEVPVGDVMDRAQRILHESATTGRSNDNIEVGDVLTAERQHMRDVAAGKLPPSITTGFTDLDGLIGGWLPGQLIIPAGRPGQGKSVAALCWALAAARQGEPVLMFPMEMKMRETLHRLWSNVGRVPLHLFKKFQFSADDERRVDDAQQRIAALPLAINDTANSIPQIRSAARRFHRKHGHIGLIIVDYVQRLNLPPGDRYDLQVGQAIKDLKTLAQELDCAVIAVCQLNRGSEQRSHKIPQLADLRDSGQLEQEADVVILIHRDDYYDKESPRAGEGDFIVAKQRSGPTDTVTVAAQLHLARFADMAIA